MVVLGQKVVVFGLNWLYSGKSGCIWAKMVEFRQSGCIRAKDVVLGQRCCIRANWFFAAVVGWAKVVVLVVVFW